jgi:hypothetical protein
MFSTSSCEKYGFRPSAQRKKKRSGLDKSVPENLLRQISDNRVFRLHNNTQSVKIFSNLKCTCFVVFGRKNMRCFYFVKTLNLSHKKMIPYQKVSIKNSIIKEFCGLAHPFLFSLFLVS